MNRGQRPRSDPRYCCNTVDGEKRHAVFSVIGKELWSTGVIPEEILFEFGAFITLEVYKK